MGRELHLTLAEYETALDRTLSHWSRGLPFSNDCILVLGEINVRRYLPGGEVRDLSMKVDFQASVSANIINLKNLLIASRQFYPSFILSRARIVPLTITERESLALHVGIERAYSSPGRPVIENREIDVLHFHRLTNTLVGRVYLEEGGKSQILTYIPEIPVSDFTRSLEEEKKTIPYKEDVMRLRDEF